MSYRWLAPLGRVLMSVIFLLSGFGKVTDWSGTAGHMAKEGIPAVQILLPLAIFAELAGGLSLLLGFKARWGALGLVAFLVPTTLIFHDFWTYQGQERTMQMINFLKNLALIGGLLQVTAWGPGPYSVDRDHA